jgi:hypothetical protein
MPCRMDTGVLFPSVVLRHFVSIERTPHIQPLQLQLVANALGIGMSGALNGAEDSVALITVRAE